MRGSLRETRPGVWELRIFLGVDTRNGTRMTASRTIHGKRRDAERELAKFVTEREDADAAKLRRARSAAGSVTVGQLIGAYIAEHEGAPGTVDAYRSTFKNHIEPTLGELPVSDLDPALLEKLYRYLRDERGLKASSVKRIHALIRAALSDGVRRGLVKTNVARDAKSPPVQATSISLPSVDDVQRVLDAATAHSEEFGVFIRLAAATGARRGELCGLRWSLLDLGSAEAKVESSVAVTSVGLIEKDTKNHSKRVIALDPATIAALREHRERMQMKAKLTGQKMPPDAFVFSNDPDGATPWRPDSVSATWNRVKINAGIPEVRLHDLRHFQATMLLKAGMPAKNVSKRLGHRDTSTTLNVYAQFLEETDRESAEVIGNLLGG